MLVIQEANELEFKVTQGPKATAVKPFRLPIGQGISGWVAETGQAVLIPDCYSDPRFDPSFDKRSGYKTRTMLCVPMIHKGIIVGVMSIINRLDLKPFDDNDQLLFTIFASQAALSIENARLVHSAIEKERLDKELQVASEIQMSMINLRYFVPACMLFSNFSISGMLMLGSFAVVGSSCMTPTAPEGLRLLWSRPDS